MEFKVERTGLFQVGDELFVTETVLESFIFYTIEHAYGMSGNISFNDALETRKGKVVSIEEKKAGIYATLEFDEEDKGEIS